MSRLIRLSYFDRVHNVIPEDFKALMPLQPAVKSLPPLESSATEASAAVPIGDSIEAIETTAASQMLAKARIFAFSAVAYRTAVLVVHAAAAPRNVCSHLPYVAVTYLLLSRTSLRYRLPVFSCDCSLY